MSAGTQPAAPVTAGLDGRHLTYGETTGDRQYLYV